jgi:hypothetical protein
MRIAHITNFYGKSATSQIDQLLRSAATYKAAGHEFIAIVPSFSLATIETAQGKIINIPSIRVPFSRGRRIILNQKLLKSVLILLDLDQVEIINQPFLANIGKWAKGRNIKVLKSGSPVEVFDDGILTHQFSSAIST